VVGQWWSTTPNVKQRWVYGKGASSELGAAWSLSGAPGSFSGSKTYSSSVDASVTFPLTTGRAGKLYRSFFKMGKYDLQEYDYITSTWYYIGTMVPKTSWERGTALTSGLAVPTSDPGNCQKYLARSDDDSAVSAAMTWTDGISLSPAMKGLLLNVTLSSRTGFTTTAKNHVHFLKRGRLCGRYGPLSHPGALIARKPL
jgi:hypothetical protein